MKQLFAIISLILTLAACRQNDRCIKGKVIRISCASFVVQVFNRDSVGSYGWRDINGHAVYNNVFTLDNPCNIGKLFQGDVIYFSVADSLPQPDCVSCMMYDAPPEKRLKIRNVSRKGCE